MSQILTTLLMLRAGYSYVPYSSLESAIEQSKEGYYLALRQTQVTVRTDAPNWQPWVMFFLRALQQQMKHLAKKIEREKIVLAALPQLSVRIIEPALRTRKSHHQRHRTTNGYEQKHLEATLPPVGRPRPSRASRQRTWRVVRITLRKRLPAINI